MIFNNLDPGYYARDLLDAFNITSLPIDPFLISDNLGIKFNFRDLDKIEAMFLLKNGKKRIILRDNEYFDNRIRFTVAHELGHYILPWHTEDIFTCYSSDILSFKAYRPQETEANYFAAELLLPTRYLSCDLNNLPYNFETLTDIASKYMVSLSSVAIKAIDFTYEPIGLIFTQDNRVKWTVQSKYMLRELYSKGTKLNQFTGLYQYYTEDKAISTKPELVYSMAWLRDGSDEESLSEQTIMMPTINAALTIIALDNNDNENDEEY